MERNLDSFRLFRLDRSTAADCSCGRQLSCARRTGANEEKSLTILSRYSILHASTYFDSSDSSPKRSLMPPPDPACSSCLPEAAAALICCCSVDGKLTAEEGSTSGWLAVGKLVCII